MGFENTEDLMVCMVFTTLETHLGSMTCVTSKDAKAYLNPEALWYYSRSLSFSSAECIARNLNSLYTGLNKMKKISLWNRLMQTMNPNKHLLM